MLDLVRFSLWRDSIVKVKKNIFLLVLVEGGMLTFTRYLFSDLIFCHLQLPIITCFLSFTIYNYQSLLAACLGRPDLARLNTCETGIVCCNTFWGFWYFWFFRLYLLGFVI